MQLRVPKKDTVSRITGSLRALNMYVKISKFLKAYFSNHEVLQTVQSEWSRICILKDLTMGNSMGGTGSAHLDH